MNPPTPSNVLTRQDYPEATVIRISVPQLRDGNPIVAAVREALYHEAEVASGPLILDFSAVEFLTSAALNWLITLRKKLRDRGQPFEPPSARRWKAGFAFFPDESAALEAIRQGEPDSLLLCGVRTEVLEVFLTC